MVDASFSLTACAVRHHNTCTPTALTMMEASTSPEIAPRIPMRMAVLAAKPDRSPDGAQRNPGIALRHSGALQRVRGTRGTLERTRNPEEMPNLWIPGSRRRGAPRND